MFFLYVKKTYTFISDHLIYAVIPQLFGNHGEHTERKEPKGTFGPVGTETNIRSILEHKNAMFRQTAPYNK